MKRLLLTTLSVAFGIGAASLALSAANAQGHEIKVSLFTPPINPFNLEFERIKKEIEQKTGGKLKLNLFHASQLGPPPRQFDLVRTGVADMAVVLLGITPGRFPLTQLSEVPGVVRAGVELDTSTPVAMALHDVLKEPALAKEHDGVRVMNFAITPNPIVITKTEIKTLADFKGKRIRHPSLVHAATIEALGAVPVLVQPGDLSEALSRGQIDGALSGYGGVASFKLQDSARFITEMPTGGMTFTVIMNPDAEKKIPADVKAVFDQYFGAGGQLAWSRLLSADEVMRRDTLTKEGVRVSKLTADELAKYKQIEAKLQESNVKDLETKGLPASDFLKKLRAAAAKHEK